MEAAETMGAGASSGVLSTSLFATNLFSIGLLTIGLLSTGVFSTIGSLLGIGLAFTSGLGSAGRLAAIFSGAGSADLGAFSVTVAGVTSMAIGRKILLFP